MSANRQGILVLAGGMLLMLVLGSVHAFSVFLEPIEAAFGAGRSDASLTYSIALVSLTAMVLAGHRLYRRFTPSGLIVLVTVVGAAGVSIAGTAETIAAVWLGYGLLFGAANGIGYGFSLQFSAQANPARRGIAMGLVTAAYGLGATLAPVPLEALIDGFGLGGGMAGLAVAVALIGPVAAVLFARSGLRLETENADGSVRDLAGLGDVSKLWLSYGTAVAAGLMAIGHATGVARAAGVPDAWIVAGPVAVAGANVLGSAAGGYLIDRLSPNRLLQAVVTVSVLALASMAWARSPAVAIFGLAAVGFAYGATIAAFPAAIANVYGAVKGIRVYGRVFTAWGAAGLAAPWTAGLLFERTNDYTAALALAAVLGLASLISLAWFPRPSPPTASLI